MTDDMDVLRITLGIHDQRDCGNSAVFRLARLGRKLWILTVDQLRWQYSSPHMVGSGSIGHRYCFSDLNNLIARRNGEVRGLRFLAVEINYIYRLFPDWILMSATHENRKIGRIPILVKIGGIS